MFCFASSCFPPVTRLAREGHRVELSQVNRGASTLRRLPGSARISPFDVVMQYSELMLVIVRGRACEISHRYHSNDPISDDRQVPTAYATHEGHGTGDRIVLIDANDLASHHIFNRGLCRIAVGKEHANEQVPFRKDACDVSSRAGHE